jgi:hypothetical protein
MDLIPKKKSDVQFNGFQASIKNLKKDIMI